MTKRASPFLAAALLLTLAACAAPWQQQGTDLSFSLELRLDPEARVVALLGFQKTAGQPALAGAQGATGVLELRDGEGRRLRRAWFPRSEQALAGFVEATRDETETTFAQWQAALPPGHYTLSWGVASFGFASLEFDLSARDGDLDLALGSEQVPSAQEAEALISGPAYAQVARPLVEQAMADAVEKRRVGAGEISVQQVEAFYLPGTAAASGTAPRPLSPHYVIDLLNVDGEAYQYQVAGGDFVFVPTLRPAAVGNLPLAVQGVQVTGQQVAFFGQARLPAGACLLTRLYAGEDPVDWWPEDTCATLDEGRWQMIVPLDQGAPPNVLDPQPEYTVRLWRRETPTVFDRFWFDLAGPRASE